MQRRSGLKTRGRREARPPREASRLALEKMRADHKEQRRIRRIIKDITPDVVVGKPTVCVKSVRVHRLKPYQRKLYHLVGTSQSSHPTFTRSPKMWGVESLRCTNKDCRGRGSSMIHGAHVSWRVDRRSRAKQCGIVATCVPCNTSSGQFRVSRGASVFVLARVVSRYPSKPYDPQEDTIIDNAIFDS